LGQGAEDEDEEEDDEEEEEGRSTIGCINA
jgi:hypothetical protein